MVLLILFSPKFFLGITDQGTYTSVFKDKKLLRSHKTVEIKIFPNIFLVD
jgi:hypothetical protein